jgi:hypothetical protein
VLPPAASEADWMAISSGTNVPLASLPISTAPPLLELLELLLVLLPSLVIVFAPPQAVSTLAARQASIANLRMSQTSLDR